MSLERDRFRQLANVSVAAGVAVFVLSTLLSSASWAGPCAVVARTYCVAGTSTPLNWNWTIATNTSPFQNSSIIPAASGALLSPGDPATAIVSLFVSDLNAKGYPSAAINGGDPECFDITSCDLYINAGLVPAFPATLTFNPTITMTSGAMVPSISQLGMITMVGIIGFAALGAIRKKRS